MKKTLFAIVVLVATLCLSGCVVATYEERRPVRHRHVVRCPPAPVVEVIEVPAPPPGPHRRPPRPHPW